LYRSTHVCGRITKLLDTPLRIAELRPSPGSGLIGITFAPGKKGRSLYGGYHDRELDNDIDVAAAWGAAACLNATLWAVSRTTDFRSAVLLAANLGQDADTTAAVTGQMAGALYGLSGIPEDWRLKLAWRERIEETALRLFEAGARMDPQAAHGE
jgi:hypothetical protein